MNLLFLNFVFAPLVFVVYLILYGLGARQAP